MTEPTSAYVILVVEDNQDIVIGVQDLLRHDGYQVDVAGTCARAVELAKKHRYNAILLDLTLPDGDGLDVLKAVHEIDPTVPVVIVTASTSTEKTVGSLTRGAFAYITKPYHREELRQTLRRAIGMKELTAKVAQAEGLLSESEERFRSLVESATDAIILADCQGTILSWNRSASALFGYSVEEAIGRPLTLLMPERYRIPHERGLARMEATGESHVIGSVVELHGLKNDGTEFPIELALASWKAGDKRFYSGILRDISERKRTETSLTQLTHRYSVILNEAGEGIYGLDRQGRTTFANPSAAAMLGYSVDELFGRLMHELLHHSRPDGSTFPQDECPIYAVLRDGVTRRIDHDTFWRKDGTHFPVEYVSTAIREGDAVVGAVVVFRDVTLERRAEAVLVASEERLELVTRGSSDGFWDGQVLPDEPWHSPRTPVWWSARVREMLGYSAEDFPDVLESWTSRLHPGDRARVFTALEAHIERREPYDVEYRLLTKQEQYEWFRARGQAIWDESGRLRRMAGSLQCISERKRAEEALRRSEQLLQDIVNHTTAVIYVKYADGRYLLANHRFEQLFNLTRDQIVGRTDHQIFPQNIADVFRANDVNVLAQNAPEEYEEQAPHSDGLHTYLSIKFPLRDETGAPYALCGISSDITQRKQVEDRLRSGEEQAGLWNWDIQADRFYWSPQASALFGMAGGPGSGDQQEVLRHVHPGDRTTTRLALRQAVKQPTEPVTFSHRVVWPDGSHHWLVWTGHLLRDRTGSPVNALGTVREGTPPRA